MNDKTQNIHPHDGKPRGWPRPGEMTDEMRQEFLAILNKPLSGDDEEMLQRLGL
jgi:hypothetical protein